MNDKTLISFIVIFIISVISFISYSTFNSETFGDEFINQVRIADSEDTLNELDDSDLINLGKEICLNAEKWINENAFDLSEITLPSTLTFANHLFLPSNKSFPGTIRPLSIKEPNGILGSVFFD